MIINLVDTILGTKLTNFLKLVDFRNTFYYKRVIFLPVYEGFTNSMSSIFVLVILNLFYESKNTVPFCDVRAYPYLFTLCYIAGSQVGLFTQWRISYNLEGEAASGSERCFVHDEIGIPDGRLG